MKTLNEVESQLLEGNHTFTTFKQCSFDDEHNEYICTNESIPVFDLDEIKEAYSRKGNYGAPMSMDAIWLKHDDNTLHLIEFKNMPKLVGNQKKDIRLKMLDTLLILNGELEINELVDTQLTILLVRNLGSKDRIKYHALAKINNYTPAYLEYISKLTGVKIIELIPEDFEKYLEDVNRFNFLAKYNVKF